MDDFDFRQNRRWRTRPPQAREGSRRSEPGESGGPLPAVTMMETANRGSEMTFCSVARVVLNGTPIGSVLVEPIVRRGPNDNSERNRESTVAGAVRSAESHGRATPGGSFRPIVPPPRSAREIRGWCAWASIRWSATRSGPRCRTSCPDPGSRTGLASSPGSFAQLLDYPRGGRL